MCRVLIKLLNPFKKTKFCHAFFFYRGIKVSQEQILMRLALFIYYAIKTVRYEAFIRIACFY